MAPTSRSVGALEVRSSPAPLGWKTWATTYSSSRPPTVEERDQRDQEAFAAVRRVVDAADPEGLLGLGAPADEYDPEVADLVRLVLRSEAPTVGEVVGAWQRWSGDDHRLTGDRAAAVVAELTGIDDRFRDAPDSPSPWMEEQPLR
jgi:hypothetical protein